MAALVPIVMGAFGVSAGVIAATTVAFAVTGVNKKINAAAAEVFGEDLVGLSSIVGMAFGGADTPLDATLGGLGETATALETGASAASSPFAIADLGSGLAAGVDRLGVGSALEGMSNLAESGSYFTSLPNYESSVDGGTNLLKPIEVPDAEVRTAVGNMVGLEEPATPVAAAPQGSGAAGAGATAAPGARAAADQTLNTGDFARLDRRATTPQQRSFFDRLVYDEKGNVNQRMAGSALMGVGNAIAANQTRRQRQKEIDQQRAAMNTGSAGWRQTQ